jgi:hypothetical protein
VMEIGISRLVLFCQKNCFLPQSFVFTWIHRNTPSTTPDQHQRRHGWPPVRHFLGVSERDVI